MYYMYSLRIPYGVVWAHLSAAVRRAIESSDGCSKDSLTYSVTIGLLNTPYHWGGTI